MTPSPARITIATRQSLLALWQSRHVQALLTRRYPELRVELLPLTTRGDRILDRPLAAIGGKGLFLKELEQALLAGRADLAVHSMKDIPVEMDPRLTIAAVLERADPADALVCPRYPSLAALPAGASVGTSSARRRVQLRAARPDLEILDLRGNVDTRLKRLDQGDFDAIVLAAAGLERLGFAGRITQRLALPAWLPAPAQGAIAIQCRADHQIIQERLAAFDHAPTRTAVELERRLAAALGADCHTAFGAYAGEVAGEMRLSGFITDDQGRLRRADVPVRPVPVGDEPAGREQDPVRILAARLSV